MLQVQASPEGVEEVQTEIKLSTMDGWSGGSKLGTSGYFKREGDLKEAWINLKFDLPSYISNIFSSALYIRLYAYARSEYWASGPTISAYIRKIELNGYSIVRDYLFANFDSASKNAYADTWIKWEIPLEYLRSGSNSLSIEMELKCTGYDYFAGAGANSEFYIYDVSYIMLIKEIRKFTISFTSEPKVQSIIVDGEQYTLDKLPYSFIWEEGSIHTFSIPKTLITTTDNRTRYIFAGWSDGNMSTSRTIMVLNSASYVAKFKTQHYVDVYSEHGTAFGSGWHDSGSTVTISVTPDTINFGNGTRIAFKSWTGDFSGSSAIANITVDSPKTIRATWGLQYYLSLDSEYGTPQGEGWYSPGQVATVSISSTIDVGNGIRKVFVGWVGDYSSNDNALSIAINRPMSLTAKWKTQHFLKVETPYGKAVGEGWYDEGSTAYARLENTEVEEFFVIIRYFTRWSGDASGDKAVSDAIYIDAPKTAIAVWGWKPNPLVVNIGILAICIVVASILLTRVPVKQAGVSLVRKTASTLKTAQRIKTKPKAEEEKPKETEKLPPPPPMGKYVVMEALGEGAFSIVYKAREENTGRLVALKVPKKSKEAEELFMKEVNRLEELGGKIRHENIVETYDFGLRPEPYIAMELCDSNIKEAKLSDDERLEVMLEVADALIYAHGKGIVHGDIKPSNILIRGGIPKIGDWGFAYTPEYAAPEIFKGEEPDERSDIWSFGVTFYELLKGFNPFSGKDVFEILEKMEREVDFSGLGRFESVIRKCLSVDNRYNSFEEVKKDLAGLKKASRTIGKDMMLYAFDSLCTSISSDNVEEVNREFRMLKEYMLLPGFVTDAMRIIWEIKLKTREEMTYSFLEANYNELLKHLDQYGRAFETDDDIGGVVRRVLAEMKNETVPEKDREAIRRIFCERSLAKLREILITTML